MWKSSFSVLVNVEPLKVVKGGEGKQKGKEEKPVACRYPMGPTNMIFGVWWEIVILPIDLGSLELNLLAKLSFQCQNFFTNKISSFLPNIFHQNKFSTCLLIAEDLSFAQFTWSSFPKSCPVYGSIKSEFRHKLDIRIWDAREFTQSDNNSQTAASMTKWSNMFQTVISIGYDLRNSNVGY